MTCRKIALAAAVSVAIAAPAAAQAPGWSRGQQNLAITYDECLRRVATALNAERYRIDYSAGNFAVGIKGVHTAVVICSPAPEARMLVQIVVASNGEGGGSERQCLQAQMEQPGAPSACGGATAPPPPPPPSPPAGPLPPAPPPSASPAGCTCGSSSPHCIAAVPGSNERGERGILVYFATPTPRYGGAIGVPDWMAFFPPGSKTGYVSWQRNEGCPRFFYPLAPGRYDLRYLEGSGYDTVRATTSVTIGPDGGIIGAPMGLAQHRTPEPLPPGVIVADDVTWTTSAEAYRGQIGRRITFTLPPNGPRGTRLYGTDIYTDDSTIGAAAVHAGLITHERGGTVTIEIRPGLSHYARTTRNGVTSDPFPEHPGSFVFVR